MVQLSRYWAMPIPIQPLALILCCTLATRFPMSCPSICGENEPKQVGQDPMQLWGATELLNYSGALQLQFPHPTF